MDLMDSREHDQLLQEHNLQHTIQPRHHDGGNDDAQQHLHESYHYLLKEQHESHQNEIEKLMQENLELKEQLRVDKCAWSLLNVLREHGDTIIVAERETKLISQGLTDLSERSEAVHMHLSSIAKDFCQKLDDFQTGIEKRQIQSSLASSPPSRSNIEDFMAENSQLVQKLQDAERRLEEAEARNAISSVHSTMEENSQLVQRLQDAERRLREAEVRNAQLQQTCEERLHNTLSDKKASVLEQPQFEQPPSAAPTTTTGKNKKKKMGRCTVQ